MTVIRRDGIHSTPFNEWIRECRELESTEFRICVTDVDLVVHRFSARNEKQRQSGSIKSIVDHIMMVEVKTNGRPTPFAQADTFGLLDQIMRKATVHNGRRWPIKVDDLRQPGRVRRVRWLGFHILCLDGIRPDDGFGIRWDSHSIPSVNILVEILRMDRDPDDPSRQLDTRRHHSIKPVQLPLLDNQGEAA